MRTVVFGLTISSTWGNGHATLWRGLSRALARRGHRVSFFERDAPYYAANRDLASVPGGELILYSDWECVRRCAAAEVAGADIAMVTSYCPNGIAASEPEGAFKTPARVLADLRRLWLARDRADEFIGTLVNAHLAEGGKALGVRNGRTYLDVGTLNGYRAAISLLHDVADRRVPGGARVALEWPAGRAPQNVHDLARS